MKAFLTAFLLALAAAVLISSVSTPKPLDDQLLYLQLEHIAPRHAQAIANEPVELQALLLSYSDDPILMAKAGVALARYPDKAKSIFLLFGESPAFQSALYRYGEDILLPIHYFLNNEVFTLELMRGLSETAKSMLDSWRDRLGEGQAISSDSKGRLTAEERAWYAIHFIDTEGYGFIGQFVAQPDGEVGWLQTERVLEGINQFFAGGLKNLESRFRMDEAIRMADVGWAAVDVAVGVGAFKLLRVGRAGVAGSSLTLSQRSAVVGAGLWRGSVIGARLVKYGAPAVLIYMAVRHPSIINSLLGTVADKLGLPVALVQIVGWTLILLPVLLVLRLLLAPMMWLMGGLVRLHQGR